MKHIKIFENVQYSPKQFSKYIVWLSGDNSNIITILKNEYTIRFWNDNKNEPVLNVKELYTVKDNKLNKKTKANKSGVINGVFLDPETLNARLIYQSKTLKDIINNLPLILQTLKYNL